MQVKFIDYGTSMDIYFADGGATSDVKFPVSFYNTVGNTGALIEGEKFFNLCQSVKPGIPMVCVFCMKAMKYSFNAEYVDTTVVNGVNLVKVKITSAVNEISQRALPRLEITMNAKIAVITEARNGYEFNAETIDISLNSISVFATLDVPEYETPAEYNIKLVFGRTSFFIPVQLLRKEPAMGKKKFQNKYIFILDFKEDKGLKDKLLFALFEHRKSY